MQIEDTISLTKSVNQTLQLRKAIGDTDNHIALFMYKLYLNLIDFCEIKISNNETSYITQLRVLRSKANKLKRQCPKICDVRLSDGEFGQGFDIINEFS